MNGILDGRRRDKPEPVLEQVLLPERHELRVAVPEGVIVHGYVPS
ncbi:hypothetical protein [Sinomonas gamaensis]|nr:hypothetical protein [Sinomonas gamaensis]